MYILDHAVAPWFLEVTLDLRRFLYFLLPQYLPWHPPAPPVNRREAQFKHTRSDRFDVSHFTSCSL